MAVGISLGGAMFLRNHEHCSVGGWIGYNDEENHFILAHVEQLFGTSVST